MGNAKSLLPLALVVDLNPTHDCAYALQLLSQTQAVTRLARLYADAGYLRFDNKERRARSDTPYLVMRIKIPKGYGVLCGAMVQGLMEPVILKVLKRHCLVLVLAFVAGCASGTREDERVAKAYRTGMTREAVHQSLGNARPLEFVVRPASGWSGSDTRYMANRAAAYFEREHHGVLVQSCEVYWIARGSNVAWVVGGVFWDYLFFDGEGKLLGYHRRVLD